MVGLGFDADTSTKVTKFSRKRIPKDLGIPNEVATPLYFVTLMGVTGFDGDVLGSCGVPGRCGPPLTGHGNNKC